MFLCVSDSTGPCKIIVIGEGIGMVRHESIVQTKTVRNTRGFEIGALYEGAGTVES